MNTTSVPIQTEQTTQIKTGFVRLPYILQTIPVGRSTWWAWVKSGKAPKPVKLSDRVTAWKAQDIHEFVQRLVAEGGVK